MTYTREITLHFTPDGNIPVVRVKQGDTSVRFIHATMTWNSSGIMPGSESTVIFRMSKPDGTSVLLDSSYPDTELGRTLVVMNDDNTVTIELVAQTTSCPGLSKCDLCFLSGEQTISTAPFVIDVEGSPDVASSAVSSDDFRTLINALQEVGRASVTSLLDMSDVSLDGVADGDVLSFYGTEQKWSNRDPDSYGYQKETDVRTIVEAYQYQTAPQVNALIAAYIASLDANETEY